MLSFIWLGVAFSLKLQAVFLCPALLILYVVRKKFSALNFLWMPAMLEAFAIPSVVVTLILHGNVSEALRRLFDIYLGQGAEAHIARLRRAGHRAVWLISGRVQFGAHTTLLLFIFSFTPAFIFLPGMHERYGMAVLVVHTAATGRFLPLHRLWQPQLIYIPFPSPPCLSA